MIIIKKNYEQPNVSNDILIGIFISGQNDSLHYL